MTFIFWSLIFLRGCSAGSMIFCFTRLTSLRLSGTYSEQPGTRPPSCITHQQLTMYFKRAREGSNSSQFINGPNTYFALKTLHWQPSKIILNFSNTTTSNLKGWNPSLDSSIGSASAWYHGGRGFKSWQGQVIYNKLCFWHWVATHSKSWFPMIQNLHRTKNRFKKFGILCI